MMIHIDERFRRRAGEFFKGEGLAWVERLPEIGAELERRWDLTILPPFPLSINYVAPVRLGGGGRAVIKLGFPGREFVSECRALKLCGGRGMARVLADDLEIGAMLLERLEPGTMLLSVQAESDERATEIAADTLAALRMPLPANHGLIPLAEWARGLKTLRERYQGGVGPLWEKEVERAEAMFRDLLPSAGPDCLLHGDYHHGNILLDRSGGADEWKVIDPKGLAGDPAYEIGQFMLNPWETLPPRAELKRLLARRLAIFCERAGLDRARALGFAIGQCSLSAWWMVEDHGEGVDVTQNMVISELLGELAG